MYSKRVRIQDYIKLLFLLLIAVMVVQIIILSRENQALRADLSQVNHIKYNLLNVETWAIQLKEILEKKIMEFELTPENEQDLMSGLQDILYKLIREIEILMEKRTEGQFSRIKRWVSDMAIDMDQLRDSVPAYAMQILTELEKPEMKGSIQKLLSDKLDQYAASTNSTVELEMQEQLFSKYNCENREMTSSVIISRLEENIGKVYLRLGISIAGVFFILLLSFSPQTPLYTFQVVVLVLASLFLLIGGVSLPMIQLVAKFDLIQFDLLGEQMSFRNNIFYYQSKSILDMVVILVKEGSVRMIFIGILIFTFSLIFPIMKLSSTLIYQSGVEKINRHSVVRFFALKSGKWSMADVMVVAIFMAYIGFNGIVNSQLEDFARNAAPVEVFTTNGTQLLPGFYMFLSFVLFGLVMAELLHRRTVVPQQ